MAKKGTKRNLTKTQKARINALRAISRREKKGVQIPESLKDQIKGMNIHQLKRLSANRYRELDRTLELNQTQHSTGTINERLDFLIATKAINPQSQVEKEFYSQVIQYALNASYGELSEASKQSHGYISALAKEALNLSAKSPEAFNTIFNKTQPVEPPTDENTIETSTLVYDSVMSLIDEAYATGTGAEQFLAAQLQTMINEEISQYGFDKVVQGMEQADGDLIERVEGYLYDSEQWVNEAWKGSLLATAQLIHGYIDDATIEQMSVLSELIEGFGET